MKHTTVLAGVLAVVLVFGSALAGWASDGNEDGMGIFTLTDIPAEYYGKYAVLLVAGNGGPSIYGAQEVDEKGELQFITITDERMYIPLWVVAGGDDRVSVDRYAGDEALDVQIIIYDDETMILSDVPQQIYWAYIEVVDFVKGCATLSWHDADVSSE
jgi:hypothetical protein